MHQITIVYPSIWSYLGPPTMHFFSSFNMCVEAVGSIMWGIVCCNEFWEDLNIFSIIHHLSSSIQKIVRSSHNASLQLHFSVCWNMRHCMSQWILWRPQHLFYPSIIYQHQFRRYLGPPKMHFFSFIYLCVVAAEVYMVKSRDALYVAMHSVKT